MEYFDKYVSNSVAGIGNQFYFGTDGKTVTGREFYKVFAKGRYNYSFLLSNIIASTYSNGTLSHKNLICDSWEIIKAGACVVGKENDVACESFTDTVKDFKPVTFEGQQGKKVAPGEFFSTDEILLDADEDDYICIEITFRGDMIPYHEEGIIPMFRKNGDRWESAKQMPGILMIGCDRKVKAKVAFLGDSITQGIGTELNSYKHWNAVIAEKTGRDYAFWNLGIGYGRASDAASDGAWLFKAKQNDFVIVCYGVNDIFQEGSAEGLKRNLREIVSKLKERGIKTLVQTIPPFDYNETNKEIWLDVNKYIMEELALEADGVFDVVPYLSADENNSHMAKYGGHPNAEGCKVWAEALLPHIKKLLTMQRR